MSKKVIPPKKKNRSITIIVILGGVVALTGLLYARSLHGEFLDYDDMDNVVSNPLIRQFSLSGLGRLFSGATLYMYTPLTFISYAFDFTLYGMDPFYFKMTNLLIHILNVVLFFLFSYRLLKNSTVAVLGALFFAIHPTNVDTICWISARSNLLSTLFFILTLLFYLYYLEDKKILRFIPVMISFLMSLLSKSSGIMLPLVLLMIDYLQQRKITWRVILEKLPVFILSVIFGMITIWFRIDSVNPLTLVDYTLIDRFLMICHTLIGYLRKFIFPFQLSEIYSYPLKTGDFLPYSYYISPFAAAGLITFIVFAKSLKREMIFGLLFFLVNILVTQAVLLEDGYMSNRYAYLPGLGIFLVMAASYNYFREKSKMHRRLLTLALGLLLLFFSIVTWQRSQVWKDTLTLFNNAVEHDPGSAFAWNNRGIARYSENDLRGALSDFEQAIRIHPKYSGAFYNRGSAYHAMKEFSRANKDYTMAINLNPNFANCYVARGNLEMDVLQNDTLALMDYSRAIQLNPANALAYYSRGVLRLRMKEVPMACEDFHRVRQLGYDRADDLIRQFCE